MIIGTCENGTTCVYDLPDNIKTAEQFESLICGYNNGRMAESQRAEKIVKNYERGLITDREAMQMLAELSY